MLLQSKISYPVHYLPFNLRQSKTHLYGLLFVNFFLSYIHSWKTAPLTLNNHLIISATIKSLNQQIYMVLPSKSFCEYYLQHDL